MDHTTLPDLHRLVEQIRVLTQTSLPEMLEPDAPILSDDALGEDAPGFYIVGLIGGKNVGKSALVNALVGREITARTSTGRGTDRVIAYVHASQSDALAALLNREAPGQFEIVTHERADLSRQVLLDLPDFDSHYTAHLEITRRMLRHMLYPIWLLSIEKYADQQPRELLRRVTAGNDPRNLVFCLNKVDQLEAAGEWHAANEIRADYGERIRRTLGLAEPPRVWMVSALHPDRFELPGLREVLSRSRSEQAVSESRDLASHRQVHSLLEWIEQQRLVDRLDRLRRLESQGQEAVGSQVAGPVLERVLPAVAADSAWVGSVTDETMRRRVARWPILNMLHLVLEPLLAALRGRIIPTVTLLQSSASERVAAHLARLPMPLSLALQSTFAQLQQSSPLISRLYADGRLWEQMPADQQAGALREGLAGVLDARAAVVRERLSPHGNPLRSLARWVFTIGAALWFVFLQPFLQIFLHDPQQQVALAQQFERIAFIFVQIFSVAFLLKGLIFLAGYYVLLWLMLRWRTQRQVERRLRGATRREPDLQTDLAAAVFAWAQDLLAPLRRTRDELESLIAQAARFRPGIPRAAA